MSGAVLTLITSVGDGAGSATVNRDYLSGFGYIPGSAQTSQSVTCSVIGGVPPYTYAWTDTGTSNIYATDDDAATTYFGLYSSTETNESSDFICTVTDSALNAFVSPNVTVFLQVRDPSSSSEIP